MVSIMGWGHSVRIDAQDNIWIVNNGTNLVGKFDGSRGCMNCLAASDDEVYLVWLTALIWIKALRARG
jgi:streptogramin lyase